MTFLKHTHIVPDLKKQITYQTCLIQQKQCLINIVYFDSNYGYVVCAENRRQFICHSLCAQLTIICALNILQKRACKPGVTKWRSADAILFYQARKQKKEQYKPIILYFFVLKLIVFVYWLLPKTVEIILVVKHILSSFKCIMIKFLLNVHRE